MSLLTAAQREVLERIRDWAEDGGDRELAYHLFADLGLPSALEMTSVAITLLILDERFGC